jgi:Niemann-Pick C1 protein
VLCCIVSSEKNDDSRGHENFLRKGFEKFYAPCLLGFPWVRAAVVLLFLLWLSASICLFPLADVGLDQELSMPEDSYVLVYFQVSCEYISRVNYVTGNKTEETRGIHAAKVLLEEVIFFQPVRNSLI